MPHMLDVIIINDKAEPRARTLRECCVREPDLRIISNMEITRSQALEANTRATARLRCSSISNGFVERC